MSPREYPITRLAVKKVIKSYSYLANQKATERRVSIHHFTKLYVQLYLPTKFN